MTKRVVTTLALVLAAAAQSGCSVSAQENVTNEEKPTEEKSSAEAVREAAATVEPTAENAESYYNNGIAYYKAGQLSRAISAFDQAIALDREFAAAFFNRGIAYENMGDLNQAIADYDRAIFFDPEVADAYYNRGNTYDNQGQFEQAVADYFKAIDLDPKFARFDDNRGIAYAFITKYDEGLSFPDVIEVEIRNDALVAVDDRGLSLYRINPESGEWNEVPKLRPSDITAEDRAYFADRGQGRKAAPWGLYYSPRPYGDLVPDPEEGVNRYMLSGVLMETPWVEDDNVVVFMLGIPNPSGEFSLLKVKRELIWYKDANPQSGELLYPVIYSPKIATGYSLNARVSDFMPMDEAIDRYSEAVGLQLSMKILLGSSPERLREYITGPLTEELCYRIGFCVETLENIAGKLDETFITAEQIKAGNYSGFDGKEFVTMVATFLPVGSRD